MTWSAPTQRTADHDGASRLTCDATRPRYAGATLRRRGTAPCDAAVVGFPTLLAARDAATEAGWEIATATGRDHCPAHRRQPAPAIPRPRVP